MAPRPLPVVYVGPATAALLAARDVKGHDRQPAATKPVSIILAMISCCLVACFFTNKLLAVVDWCMLPYIQWLVLMIYAMSFSFVFGSSILQFGFGSDLNYATCSAATFLCLGAYVATKVFIYLFLVDRAHIVRDKDTARLKSKLYLINSFGMMGIYIIIVILNFNFRITSFNDGICIIGMQQPVMIPLIAFDVFVNVYLTFLFLVPLAKLYSIKVRFKKPRTLQLSALNIPRTAPNVRLQRLAVRTFIGSCCTLASSVANLTTLMVLNGEVSWLCLMCCNSDILFSAIVIQWLTANDHAGSKKANRRSSKAATASTSDETPLSLLQGNIFGNALKSPTNVHVTQRRRNSIP